MKNSLLALALFVGAEAFTGRSINGHFLSRHSYLNKESSFSQGASQRQQRVRNVALQMADPSNEEIMTGWIEEMIYSGDMAGYVNRYSTDLVCEEFEEFLGERVQACDDEDERIAVTEALNLISRQLRSTDGMGADSDLVFENRLNQILFTAPNRRKQFIKDNLEEMTDGFIDYIQQDIKNSDDQDSKVVLASVLKTISTVKGQDVIGGASAMLQFADETLGDEFKKEDTLAKFSGQTASFVGDRNEKILGALMFSERDILEDVLNNLHEIDDKFIEFLQGKIANSQDIEERVALQSLCDIVTNVLEKMAEVEEDGGVEEPVMDEELGVENVRRRMNAVQMGKLEGATLDEDGNIVEKERVFEVKQDKRDTFTSILERFLDRPADMSIQDASVKFYDLCDYEFMNMLKEEISTCYREGADIEAAQYKEILDAISGTMVSQIRGAQERLQDILSKGHPKAMESEIVAMARRGEIDESLILLIEANIQQAEAAGAAPAAAVMKQLIKRANDEKEKTLPDEQRLLRAMMRIDSSEERKGLLHEGFRPTKTMKSDGEQESGPPLITPPVFIRVVKDFITSFGNVDGFNILGRAQLIVDEAQEVATELYGEGMTPRQQQDFMFKENTVSVWDLGNFEDQAMLSGEEVPWGNEEMTDDMSPEDMLGERVRRAQSGGMSGVPGEDITHKY
jgi:hypothetical protein